MAGSITEKYWKCTQKILPVPVDHVTTTARGRPGRGSLVGGLRQVATPNTRALNVSEKPRRKVARTAGCSKKFNISVLKVLEVF